MVSTITLLPLSESLRSLDFEKRSSKSFIAPVVCRLREERKQWYSEHSTPPHLYRNIWLNICNQQSTWKTHPFFLLVSCLLTLLKIIVKNIFGANKSHPVIAGELVICTISFSWRYPSRGGVFSVS